MHLDDCQLSCRYIIHDRYTSFIALDKVMKGDSVKIVKTPFHAPKCNAYAERFVREARETLNNIIPLGRRHFHHVLKEIQDHHNRDRPHQGIGNCIPAGFEYLQTAACPIQVKRISKLGGLLNNYYKDAA